MVSVLLTVQIEVCLKDSVFLSLFIRVCLVNIKSCLMENTCVGLGTELAKKKLFLQHPDAPRIQNYYTLVSYKNFTGRVTHFGRV